MQSESAPSWAGRAAIRGVLRFGVVIVSFGALLSTGTAGGAVVARPFTATAVASATRVRVTVPPQAFTVEEVADGGASVAQAQVSSFGGKAFASSVYPGDTVVTAPQLAALAGVDASPEYPLYAAAEHPLQPSTEVEGPAGYGMEAEAGEQSAAARARAGAVQSADATVTHTAGIGSVAVEADGTVVARAEAVSEGIAIAGVLRVGSIRSVAESVWRPADEHPTTAKTTTEVVGSTVNGVPVSIGPDGVQPLGVGFPEAGADAASALADAGIEVRLVDGASASGEGSSDVLEVVLTQSAPVPGNPGATVRYRFGGATALVAPAPDDSPPVEVDDVSFVDEEAFATTDTPSAESDVLLPIAPPDVAAAPALPAPATGVGAAAPASAVDPERLARDLNAEVGDVYLVLLATAFAGAASVLGARRRKVRA